MSESRVSEPSVQCKDCGLALPQPASLPVEQRTPCPQCGSTARLINIHIAASVTSEGHLGYRSRHPGKGKWLVQQYGGDSFYRKEGRWHKLTRIIDRVQNWYYEHITDAQTGEMIRHCEAPLSEHRNQSLVKRSAGNDLEQ